MADEMKKELVLVRDKIMNIKQEIAQKIAADFTHEKMIREAIYEFVVLLSDRLYENKDEKAVMERAVVFGRNIGEKALENENKLDDSLNRISVIRRTLWDQIKEILLRLEVSLEAALHVADRFDPLFDKVIYAFSTAYIKSYRESLDRAEDEFLTLSAPIVTITENIAVLPIIGGVDKRRAEVLMNKSLKEATEKNLSKLFIDLSGVALIDTMVAYLLYKIIRSLDLVGVTTVLVGIRPEVTQTMVSLGVEFSDVKTYGSLHQALSKQMDF